MEDENIGWLGALVGALLGSPGGGAIIGALLGLIISGGDPTAALGGGAVGLIIHFLLLGFLTPR